MKKISLDLDTLQVESFATGRVGFEAGTIKGYEVTAPELTCAPANPFASVGCIPSGQCGGGPATQLPRCPEREDPYVPTDYSCYSCALGQGPG